MYRGACILLIKWRTQTQWTIDSIKNTLEKHLSQTIKRKMSMKIRGLCMI